MRSFETGITFALSSLAADAHWPTQVGLRSQTRVSESTPWSNPLWSNPSPRPRPTCNTLFCSRWVNDPNLSSVVFHLFINVPFIYSLSEHIKHTSQEQCSSYFFNSGSPHPSAAPFGHPPHHPSNFLTPAPHLGKKTHALSLFSTRCHCAVNFLI